MEEEEKKVRKKEKRINEKQKEWEVEGRNK